MARLPKVPRENIEHSTKASPGYIGNRTRSEKRVGTGNTRKGSVGTKKAASKIRPGRKRS